MTFFPFCCENGRVKIHCWCQTAHCIPSTPHKLLDDVKGFPSFSILKAITQSSLISSGKVSLTIRSFISCQKFSTFDTIYSFLLSDALTQQQVYDSLHVHWIEWPLHSKMYPLFNWLQPFRFVVVWIRFYQQNCLFCPF